MDTIQRDRVMAWIDDHFDEQVAFLQALVRQPSDNPPGDCAAHAELAGDLLDAMGFNVERYQVPAEFARRHGMVSATNLIVRQPFGADGPTVALNAHGDVVPPGDGWTHDPYGAEVVDGWMFGRGAAVSKSDYATYAFALRALMAAGLDLSGTAELHFTYDEETGGMTGPGWLLEQGLTQPDFVISAALSYSVIVAHNGCLHLEVTVRGRSAHAGRPETGHDALEAATAILNALYAHRAALAVRKSETPGIDHPTLVVGLISGGINTNVVPDQVRFRIDRRIVPEEIAQEVESETRDVIEAAAAGLDGISVDIDRILLARPFIPRKGSDRLNEILCRNASAVMGEPVTVAGVPLYTDARLYSEAGIPTAMYGAGPRSVLEANGHRADERLELDDLRKATKVVALAVAELLGAGKALSD
ncbi:MAG: M20/M25/M40 family metallo-hydrolase [Alphaproteobacteria bacterium]|nr:M20/M25/M40 family metallo-hydrolase [Alphaproteobacteria bacterium]